MKHYYYILFLLFALHYKTSYSQDSTNHFRIGIFGTSLWTHYTHTEGYIPYSDPYVRDQYPSSVLNVLSQDGFDTYARYEACSSGTRENYLKSELLLAQKLGMKMHVGLGYYFKPFFVRDTFYGTGENIYDGCGYSLLPHQSPEDINLFRVNYNRLFAEVFSNPLYKNGIWGYHLVEEGEYCHIQHRAQDCKGYLGWSEFENKTAGCNIYTHDFPYYCKCETPPSYVKMAKKHFRDILYSKNVYDHYFITMPAIHSKSINEQSNDGDRSVFDSLSHTWTGYNSQDYVKFMNQEGDAVFEGSYTPAGPRIKITKEKYDNIFQNGYHYLGQYKSLDYIRNYCKNAHKVIGIGNAWYQDGSGYLNNYHFDTALKNANWLWFQAYTSVIHGANGLWFWWLHDMWQKDENPATWDQVGDSNRYDRENFPKLYKNYVSPLVREIRYLVNQNLISSHPATVLMGKTDHTDTNGIVPPAKSYIKNIRKDYRTENYGLRYTLRTNGTQVIMIISNPLYKKVSANLDFTKISNINIQQSDSIYIVYSEKQKVNDKQYKVKRFSYLHTWYALPFSSKKIKLDFAPFDVHIIYFGMPPSFK